MLIAIGIALWLITWLINRAIYSRKTYLKDPSELDGDGPAELTGSPAATSRRRPRRRAVEGRASAALAPAERLRHAGDDQGPVLATLPRVQGRLAVDLRTLTQQRHGDRLAGR